MQMENPKSFRKNLAGSAKVLPLQERRDFMSAQKQSGTYWDARTQVLQERQEPLGVPMNEGKGVLIAHKNLYHGSATPGIQSLQRADEYTIGAGVYLTSEAKDAIGYVSERMKAGRVKMGMEGTIQTAPVLYETEIDNLKFLDLRNENTAQEVMEGYRKYALETYRGIDPNNQEYADGIRHEQLLGILRRIGEIKAGTSPIAVSLKEFTSILGELFSEYVASLGYDGLIAIEGGEAHESNHDSYVVFDPSKVKVIHEQSISI